MNPEERNRLASEHVLGLLDGEDGQRAERLLDSDPDFAALVAAWQARLAALDATAVPLAVPDGLWQQIETAIDQPIRVPAPRRTRLAELWSSVALWRPLAFAGAAASVILAAGLGVVALRHETQPIFVAVLVTDANQPAAIVNAYENGRTELVPLRSIDVPAGRALQVWTLWDRSRGPVSIGLMDRPHALELNARELPRTAPEQLFEITLEPERGSPTGRPTGPILMKGLTSRVL